MFKGTWNSFYLRSIRRVAAKLASKFVGTKDGFNEVSADGDNIADAEYVAPAQTSSVIGEASVDGQAVDFKQ
ncbi:hypothetical protein P3547_19880 [Vibrio parahaemolyticus]|nr:hypothetical protein [Vibrio parahaemolyticus]